MPSKTTYPQQKHLGKFISELRKQKGLTQEEFAKKLKTSQSAVARMEKGMQNISFEMLMKISDVLQQNIVNISQNTASYVVKGGKKLKGEITTNTSKNGAVCLMFAAMINREKTILKNVPRIEEVNRIVELFKSIGISVTRKGKDMTISVPAKLKVKNMDTHTARRTRSSILLLGALSGYLKEYTVPSPGGCLLGTRTIFPHIKALEKMGIIVDHKYKFYKAKVNILKKSEIEIVMTERSDLGTVNAILAASFRPAITTIRMASANYQVQEVCVFLSQLGVEIKGIGTHTLIIKGGEFKKSISYTLAEDPIESMLFLTAGIMTDSKITIKRCPIDFLLIEIEKLKEMGVDMDISSRYKSYNGYTDLVDIKLSKTKNLKSLPIKIEPAPYPGLNIDNLPFFVPIATKAYGETMIFDWIYENRAIYYTELNKLGANIYLADAHRVFIKGPTPLHSTEIVSPPALRPAAIILIAMLAAKGTSVLRNVYTLNRGYEDICLNLQKIGADIKIVNKVI